jgi:hypothetical protein
MSISIKRCGTGVVVLILLLLTGGRVAAQTSSTDQSVNNLPQQVKTNGENKLVAKTNTVSNNAADKVDTLGTKAFKGFVGMFKKKKKTGTDPGGGTPPPPGTPPPGTTPPSGTQPPPGGTPSSPGTPPPPGGTPPPPGGTPPPPGTDTTTHKHG